MSDPEQYRRFADECLILAEEEGDGGPRLKVLLEMAGTWMELAQKASIDSFSQAAKYQGRRV